MHFDTKRQMYYIFKSLYYFGGNRIILFVHFMYAVVMVETVTKITTTVLFIRVVYNLPLIKLNTRNIKC